MDIKKLIVGFLILAAAAGSSALLLSNLGSSSQSISSSQSLGFADANATAGTLDQNTLTPVQTTPVTVVGTDVASSTGTDPNNLTSVLTDSLLAGVAAANPNGPQDDGTGTGNQTLAPPDQQVLASELSSNQALQNVRIPDWDLEAAEQTLHLATSSSQDAVMAYATALNDILNEYFVASGIQKSAMQGSVNNPDPAVIVRATLLIKGALTNTTRLETPAPLVDFQKSVVKLLVYEKNMTQLVQDASVDPVKASLIYQGESAKYDLAVQGPQDEFQKAQKLLSLKGMFPSSPSPEDGVATFVNNLFGIKTANAQWAVTDWLQNILTQLKNSQDWAHWLKDQIDSLLLQILKNVLINFIQKRALQWVTGGPEPRFIKQWGADFINSGVMAASHAIDQQMQCLQPEFQKPIVTTLKLFYKNSGTGGGAAACATPPIRLALGGNSLAQFYRNFNNGGWTAYGASMLPSGNFFGNLFFAAQTAGSAQQTAQTTQQAKNISAQGFKGDLKCGDGTDPNGTHLVCHDWESGAVYDPWPATSCDPSDSPEKAPNNGLCADGSEPEVTTPGQTTNQGLSGALTSNIHLIVNANNIAGILVAMANSLFNSLIQASVSALNGALNNAGLNSAGANNGAAGQINTLTGTAAGNSPPPQAVACSPTTEALPISLASTTQGSAYFGATGGANDANGLPPTYTWTALGGNPVPVTQTGIQFSPTYSIFLPGTYTYNVQVTASTGGTATCQIQITAR